MGSKMKKVIEKTANLIIKEATYNELLNRVAQLEADLLESVINKKKAEEFLHKLVKVDSEYEVLISKFDAQSKELAEVKKELAVVKEMFYTQSKELAVVNRKFDIQNNVLIGIREDMNKMLQKEDKNAILINKQLTAINNTLSITMMPQKPNKNKLNV